jgi:putative transposase
MAHPARNARPYQVLSGKRLFFVTTKPSMSRRLLQSERNATLLIDVLRSNVGAGKFKLHDFVIMPDHVHLLMTLPERLRLKKLCSLLRADFLIIFKREFGFQGEVWQRGFSEVRVKDGLSFLQHRAYIVQNPVAAGVVDCAEEWPYCYNYLAKKKAQGLKPIIFSRLRPD